MARNRKFASACRPAPFEDDRDIQLVPSTVTGPLPFLNPTRARYKVVGGHAGEAVGGLSPAGTEVQWRSRDNRKGRHIITVSKGTQPHLRPTSHPLAILRGILRMFTTFPYWDISYLVAVSFTLGCMIFIGCGLLAWMPLEHPDLAGESSRLLSDWSGWTAFVGATLFQTGAFLMVLEAWNEERTGCFGWALRRAVDGRERLEVTPDINKCRHHHHRKGARSSSSSSSSRRRRGGASEDRDEKHAWQWYPSWTDLRTHYLHEIGFLASVILTLGATVFYVSGFLAMPPLYDLLSDGVLYGVYYLSYLVGGVLFIVSSGLYMLETQSRWYLPAPRLLGWHVGLWNMVGSIGWTMAAAFGYCAQAVGGDGGWCEYQSQLSLVWASVAFTIGSALLWYEAVNKYTIERHDGAVQEGGDSTDKSQGLATLDGGERPVS